MDSGANLGFFGKLPFELRRKIYTFIFEGQIVHCCSILGHRDRHGIARAASPVCPCSVKAFEKECLECCESDFESVTTQYGGWSHVVSYSHSVFSPSDWLSLFLTCRTVFEEAEPLSWNLVTLSIGAPQFGAFYHQFLREKRDAHSMRTSRGQLLRNIQLLIPDYRKLVPSAGIRYTDVVGGAMDESMTQLALCTRLRNVSVIIAASLASQPRNWHDLDTALVLQFPVFGLILRLRRPLKGFSIAYLGQLHHESRAHGDNYDDLPDTDISKRSLQAISSVLVEVVLGRLNLDCDSQSDHHNTDDKHISELDMHVQRYLRSTMTA